MSGHLNDIEHPLQVSKARGVAGGEAEAVSLGRGCDQQVEPPQPGVTTGSPDQVRLQQAAGLRRRDVEQDDVERVDDELLPPPAPLSLDGSAAAPTPYSSFVTVITVTATKSAIDASPERGGSITTDVSSSTRRPPGRVIDPTALPGVDLGYS